MDVVLRQSHLLIQRKTNLKHAVQWAIQLA
ncbi:Uncharacterised protein [Vibrio cholerae]|uniref:Uncharacterized protein n=1 Tax=Vibrio cholerae TaxID=666 RepID=A0A655XPF8_VIBCL|nr:Uncharacterised protein [Vibrio cholerae]CSB70677.1 Uncharacterised protein [Vibrio cholerae]CSB88653.1 Uncharacterised protein [Vibrio cholerae]CSC16869.1 Uncharacterised protein [Vibrio cholerae]CSC34270.1 Uncharacterised protein [Vibrio cholerae]